MDLSRAQQWALLLETDSARNLLASGVSAVRSADATVDAWDSILTALSIGVEKTLKLCLGLGDLATTGSWSSQQVMKRTYRHDILAMWSTLQDRLDSALKGHPYPGWVLQQLQSNRVLLPTFTALNRYANEGRFFYLDELADLRQEGESPLTAWLSAEQVALEIVTARALAELGDDADDAARAEVWIAARPRAEIADAVAGWSLTIAVCGLHGAFGAAGKRFGVSLRQSRPLPDMPR